MAAEFVKRVQMRDFDSDSELWLERQDSMILVGMNDPRQGICLQLDLADAVILAQRIRELAVAPSRITYAQESEYPDY